MLIPKNIRLKSVYLIPLSFLIAILIGTLLLSLPVSSAEGKWTSFTDALFSATTSMCVTGLVVKETFRYWSLFGQVVILILIQIGGIGVLTAIATLMLITRKHFTLSDRLMLRDALNLDSISGLLGFLTRIICGTLAIEAVGAVLYMFAFVPRYGPARGIWVSVFNAVSAFCNAGMDILGPDSLMSYRQNPLVLIVTMILIVSGGLGYVVWMDIRLKITIGHKRGYSPGQICRRFSEHTKLVMSLTGLFLFLGTVIIFFAEYKNPQTLGGMSLPYKLLNSLFESVTLRTAGFASFSQSGLTDVSCLSSYLLMFIGGSPIGTAGGVKTTTFYLAVINVASYITSNKKTYAFRRSVSAEQMKKAAVIIEVSLATVMLLLFLLLATNPVNITDGMFEIVSACGTVGLTRDLTPTLNTAGKLIVTTGMYLGRIGPISMACFLAAPPKDEPAGHYAEGDFYIG